MYLSPWNFTANGGPSFNKQIPFKNLRSLDVSYTWILIHSIYNTSSMPAIGIVNFAINALSDEIHYSQSLTLNLINKLNKLTNQYKSYLLGGSLTTLVIPMRPEYWKAKIKITATLLIRWDSKIVTFSSRGVFTQCSCFKGAHLDVLQTIIKRRDLTSVSPSTSCVAEDSKTEGCTRA